MKVHRVGSAEWSGNLKEGKGAISTRSPALSKYPYGFDSRLNGVRGTNPEELLAAAHAGCFTMGLVMMLERIGKVPLQIETAAEVTLESTDDGYVIPSVHLKTRASVPDLDESTFVDVAAQAKIHNGCPRRSTAQGPQTTSGLPHIGTNSPPSDGSRLRITCAHLPSFALGIRNNSEPLRLATVSRKLEFPGNARDWMDVEGSMQDILTLPVTGGLLHRE